MFDKMLKGFNDEYDYLYNNHIDDGESVDKFDEKLENDFSFNLLVSWFAEMRHDFISSDREAAAFMRMYEKMLAGA